MSVDYALSASTLPLDVKPFAGCLTIYSVAIANRSNYEKSYYAMLSDELYDLFQKIMKYDRYCLQYIEHPLLGEAAKIKLRKSPHRRIKNINDDDATRNSNEFYLGA